jgi:hypothetical protein
MTNSQIGALFGLGHTQTTYTYKVAVDMSDHQKPTGSVYDQGERNIGNLEKNKKKQFKMRVSTSGLMI